MAAKRKKKKTHRPSNALEDHAPLKHQIKHEVAPVEPHTVREYTYQGDVKGQPRYALSDLAITVRRRTDKRIWDRIDGDPAREKAADLIMNAWRRRTSGVGMSSFDPARVRGKSDATALVELNQGLERDYAEWIVLCKSHDIEWRVVTDLFCTNISAQVIETTARKRHGWAADEMVRALDMYCVMKGWKQKERAA